jgi:16S rRNA (adenine1518-N6/adenine1519-N6)-dimethyltransferase
VTTSRRRRALGQHFLADRGAVRRIVAALEPTAGDAVLEIGPGRGALTVELLCAFAVVAAVEIDPALADALRRRFAPERLVLLEGDVLRISFAEVARAIGRPAGARIVVAGNLPYSISKPVARKLVSEYADVDRAVLMFQREVAERLTAAPGGRSYGPLTVLVGSAFEVERLFDLGPRAFRPPPAVDSTVVRLRARCHGGAGAPHDPRLPACLAACFARRRRTLRNNVRAALGDDPAAEALLEAAGLDGGSRPETVPPEGYARLAALWPRG